MPAAIHLRRDGTAGSRRTDSCAFLLGHSPGLGCAEIDCKTAARSAGGPRAGSEIARPPGRRAVQPERGGGQAMIPTGSRPARRRFGGGRLIIAAIVAIVSIITYYSQRSSNPVTGEVQHVDLSPQQEVALGLQAAPEMAQQYGGLHPDAEAQAVVDRVGRRHRRAQRGARHPLPVRVPRPRRRGDDQRLRAARRAGLHHRRAARADADRRAARRRARRTRSGTSWPATAPSTWPRRADARADRRRGARHLRPRATPRAATARRWRPSSATSSTCASAATTSWSRTSSGCASSPRPATTRAPCSR